MGWAFSVLVLWGLIQVVEYTSGSFISFYCRVVFYDLDVAVNFLNEFSTLSRLNILCLWLDEAPGPPTCTSILEDVRGPLVWRSTILAFPRHNLPSISIFLALSHLLCPISSA